MHLIQRPLPRHGGATVLLLCNRCERPRRALYGSEAIKHASYMLRADWLCRRCANLSYASEGGALVYRSRWGVTRLLSGLRLDSRPPCWEPLVFTSPLNAVESPFVDEIHLVKGAV